MSDEHSTAKVPALLTLSPAHLIPVTDADEEIFELYTKLAGLSEGTNAFSGKSLADQKRPTHLGSLGFLDSGSSTLNIRLQIHSPKPLPQELTRNEIKSSARSKKKKSGSGGKHQVSTAKEIEVTLKQDVFAINHRSGDTGSIVWRASIHLAELLWYELLFPATNDLGSGRLLDMKRLVNSSNILELGSGTGCLAVLCDSMFPANSTSSWTSSDQFELLTNISRNMNLNQIQFSTSSCTHSTRQGSRHVIDEIDWIQVEKHWIKQNSDPSVQQAPKELSTKYDLILAVDCLYNESLVLPFLRTIDLLSTPSPSSSDDRETSPTLVLVVSELRSDQVLSSFLNHWLLLQNSAWNVFRVSHHGLRSDLNLNLSNPNYVVWCGWKK